MKVSGPRPVHSKRNCDQLVDKHGTGVGGQSNFSLAKQPQLNNQDLKNPNPQNHSKPVKSLQRLPVCNSKHGEQAGKRNHNAHKAVEHKLLDTRD